MPKLDLSIESQQVLGKYGPPCKGISGLSQDLEDLEEKVLSQDLEEKSECAVCWQIDSKEKGENMLAQFLLSNSQFRKVITPPTWKY